MSIMDEVKHIIEEVKQKRDEIEVQLNLGKMEVKDIWEETEGKLEDLKSKSSQVAEEAGDTAKNTLEAAKLLAGEIKKGYENIKKIL